MEINFFFLRRKTTMKSLVNLKFCFVCFFSMKNKLLGNFFWDHSSIHFFLHSFPTTTTTTDSIDDQCCSFVIGNYTCNSFFPQITTIVIIIVVFLVVPFFSKSFSFYSFVILFFLWIFNFNFIVWYELLSNLPIAQLFIWILFIHSFI